MFCRCVSPGTFGGAFGGAKRPLLDDRFSGLDIHFCAFWSFLLRSDRRSALVDRTAFLDFLSVGLIGTFLATGFFSVISKIVVVLGRADAVSWTEFTKNSEPRMTPSSGT